MHDINEGAIGKLSEAIQSHEIHFNFNDSLPAPGQDAVLDQVAEELTDLASCVVTTRKGPADETGAGETMMIVARSP